ncbi:MAG: hypothetical protein ACXWL8_02910 [Candidatus Limnocylindria bacterium]
MRLRTIAGVGGLASAAALLWIRPWRTKAPPSALLDEVLPDYEFRDTIVVDADAPPERILRALRDVTLRDMPIAWTLGELRYLPRRLRGHASGADGDQPFLAGLRASSSTIVLAEHPDELAMGMVGRLHQLSDQEPQPLTGAHCFMAFDRHGFEKLAISVRVIPDDGRTRVILEHRTHALGTAARLRFGPYWLVIKPMGAFVSYQMLLAVRRLATRHEPAPPEPVTPAEVPGMAEMIDELEASFA